MNIKKDTHPDDDSPVKAIKKTSSLVSVVWLIPLVALIVGLWLLIANIRSSGPDITLHMENAEDISTDNTVIKILNVEVGRVRSIRLNPEHNGVTVVARMNASAQDLLKTDTQFWVVKPRVDQTGITGLGTLVSGAYIEMSPGKNTEEARSFAILDTPPVTSSEKEGIHIRLVGQTDRLLSVGSPVLYKNVEVGRIERANFEPNDQTTQYLIFITKPNDVLLHSNTHFWMADSLGIEATGKGLSVNTLPLGAMLGGAIAFGKLPNEPVGGKVAENAVFKIYNSQTHIPHVIHDNAQYLVAFFDQSIRSLPIGANIEYKGVMVGTVAEVPYFQKGDKAKLFEHKWIPVLLNLDASFLDPNIQKEAWKNTLHKAVKGGLRASLSTDSLLTGNQYIELLDGSVNTTLFHPQAEYGTYQVIPTVQTGFDGIQEKLNHLLDKFNQLPLDQTMSTLNKDLEALKQTLTTLNQLLNQKDVQDLPSHINQSLDQLDTSLKKAEPILRTLNENPNSLIFNKNKPDPIPKGK